MKLLAFIIISIFISSCYNSDSDLDSTIQFKVIKSDALNDDVIFIAINKYYSNWEILGELDQNTPVGGPAWISKEYKTSGSGSINFDFKLISKSNKLISQGGISLPLKNDWAWTVEFWHSDFNPINGCFGCYGSKSFAILNSDYITDSRDSIFVIFAGNSISNPLIY